MHATRGLLIIGLILVCWPTGVCAAPVQKIRPVILPVVGASDIRFTHVFFGGGPAHSKAHRIVQDDQGFVWLATADRLQRYDGYDVREYRQPLSDPNVFIQSLFKDRSGALWVARDRGIGLDKVPFGALDRYDPAIGTFTPVPPRDPWFQAPVNDITQDRKAELWFSTSEGLIRMDPSTGRTVRYRHRQDDPASLTSSLVRSTIEARDGTFWVASTGGVDLFDRTTAKVIQRIPLVENLPAQSRPEALVIHLFEDHSGVLWAVLSYGYGLARVDRSEGKLIFYSLDGKGTDDPARSGARAIQEDRSGTLWIGTIFSGVLKLDPDRTRFTHYRNNPSDPESLGGDAILDMCLDREGNMWVGTNDAGVDRFPTHPLLFKRYRHEPGNPNSLDTDYTTTVFEDSRDILWVGSRRTLGALNRKTGRMTFYGKTGRPGDLSDPWVHSVAEDRSGYLWFGTLNGGLNRFDRRNGKFNVYRHDPADPFSLRDNRVLRVFLDHRGILWAGTESGLDARTNTGRFQHYLDGIRIRDIAEDAQGVLWVAARATGLVRLDPATSESKVYPMSSDKAWAVTVDRSGIIWVGTENGLNRFDPATQSVTTYYESDGLPDNGISHILEDEQGNLWVSTHNGLSRFDPRAKTFKNYYVSDGLSGNEFYDNSSSFKSPSGEIFFSANGGVTSFFPPDIVDDPAPPPVVITDFKILGNSVSTGGKSPLKRTISFADTVILSHSQNLLTLEFSALSYTSPERNRYRYRLEPLQTAWSESEGGRRSITYAVTPGEYVFRVQGSDRRGVWNEKGASVRLIVQPVWWNTWQFRTTAMALILISLAYAYRLHTQNLQRQFDMRLEERISERSRIARDLHDTLLQSFQGLLLHFQGARNLFARRPEEALRILDGAIDKAEEAIVEGRDAIQDLRSGVVPRRVPELLASIGKELAESPNAPNFSVTVEGVQQDLNPVVCDEIYRIAREGLRNAFRHASARRIEVEVRYGEQFFHVRIRDDGKGIDAAVLNTGGRSGHYGVPGMRERAKQIGAQFDLWSEAGAGTEIELAIPARAVYQKPSGGRSRYWIFHGRTSNVSDGRPPSSDA